MVDIVTGYATLAEVKRIEDFEGAVRLGLGVARSGSPIPIGLVIEFQAGT